MDVVRDFALIRGLVYPTSAFTEMRIFAGEVHNVDIDHLVGHAHDNCRRMVRENGTPVGASVHRGTFEASLLGSFMWWVWGWGGAVVVVVRCLADALVPHRVGNLENAVYMKSKREYRLET